MFALVEILINNHLELVVRYTDRHGCMWEYRGVDAWRWMWISRPAPSEMPQEPTLEELEAWYIGRVLSRYAVRTESGLSGINRAADVLGITKKTLWVKRQKYGLDDQIPVQSDASDP